MPLSFSSITLPGAADFHVHLRDGNMSAAVVPTIRKGGCNQVYVMPNLVPPVTTVQMALDYKSRLEALDPSIDYLMTLYLHESITPEVVHEAKKAGIVGIKSYPAGVTTNSSSGVISYESFYPVFAAMEEAGLVLNLHGECPSSPARDITILNAESRFLPTLKSIHARFPKLKIVLEHCTTADAVATVKECGDTVVGTITAHHLCLLVDDWAGDVYCYCKPVAKTPGDRLALLRAAVEGAGKDDGHGNGQQQHKFFLGTDSAPHDWRTAKKGMGNTAAGVFTQPYACQIVLTALEEAVDRGDIDASAVTEDVIRGFLGAWGRKFYGVEHNTKKKKEEETITLKKGNEIIVDSVVGEGLEVVPFRRGKETWSVEWS